MENLRIIREMRNKNQLNVAINVGVSQGEISAYEAGRRYPKPTILIKLAKFLDTSTDYLLGITDDPTPIRLMNNNLTEEEKELLNYYSLLAEEDKIKLVKYMQDFKNENND